jgi:flagella basal body P-ring formation protein FlgA
MTRFPFAMALGLQLALPFAPALSDPVWVATRTLHRGELVRAGDAAANILPVPPFDALPASRDAIGLEVRQTVYAGRALTLRDVGAPYLVKVSAPVDVIWTSDGLELELSGRALDSGALGDDIRVLNPATSRTLHGRVVGEGRVDASGAP